MIKSAFLALRVAQDDCQMPGGLDDGCQGVWRVGTRRSGHISGLDNGLDMSILQGGNERALWRSDVHPGIDAGLQSSKVQVPRLVKARIESFPHASAYLILVI